MYFIQCNIDGLYKIKYNNVFICFFSNMRMKFIHFFIVIPVPLNVKR